MKNESLFDALHQVGSEPTYAAYTSASKKVYDPSFKYQLVISSKHGKDLSLVLPADEEQEVLFMRDSEYIVKNRQDNTIEMEEKE